MPKKGGKKGKGKKSGAAAATAATTASNAANKVVEPVDTVTPPTEVEDTVAASEPEGTTAAAENVEAPTTAATTTTTTAADTITKSSTSAPPDFTEAASNAAKFSFPITEGLTAQGTQGSKASQLGPSEEGSDVSKSKLATIPATSERTSTAVASLPERPKDKDSVDDAHVKRPYENSITKKDEEEHKLPKVSKEEDIAGAKASGSANTTGGKETATARLSEEKTRVQPQIVPGLGSDPADQTSKALEVPGLGPANNLSTTIAPSTAKGVQTTEELATSTDDKAKDLTGAPKKTTTVSTPSAATAIGTTTGVSAVDSSIEKGKEALPGEKEPAAASAITGVPALENATDKTKESTTFPSQTEAVESTAPSTGAGMSSFGTVEEKAKEAPTPLAQKNVPQVTRSSAGATDTGATTLPSSLDAGKQKATETAVTQQNTAAGITGTSAVDTAKEKAEVPATTAHSQAPAAAATAGAAAVASPKDVSASAQQETPAVTRPSAAHMVPEKAAAAPTAGQSGTVTAEKGALESAESTKPVGMPSSFHPEGRKAAALAKKRLSAENPAVQGPTTDKAQETAPLAQGPEEVQTAPPTQAAQTADSAAAKAEEDPTVAGQDQETAKTEAAKTEKRKSGGFWGWVKRKVKGT